MFRSVSWQVGLMVLLACSSVWAQENRVEISGVAGTPLAKVSRSIRS